MDGMNAILRTRWALALICSLGLAAAVQSGTAQDLEFQPLGDDAETVPAPTLPGIDFPATQQQVVRLTESGKLVGSVSVFSNRALIAVGPDMPIRLVRSGQIVGITKTDPVGGFQFSGLEPGVYTLLAAGPDLIAVYSITALPMDDVTASPLDIIAVGGIPFQRTVAMAAGSLPAVALGVASPVVNNGSNIQIDQTAIVAAYRAAITDESGTYRVLMTPTGGIEGQVTLPGIAPGSVDLSRTTLRAFREGQMIAETMLGVDGRYSIAAIGPGPIGLVFFGPDGFAAMGMELVAKNLNAGGPAVDETLVALQGPAAPAGNVVMAPNSDVQPALGDVSDDFPGNEPVGTPLDVPPPMNAGAGFAGGAPGPGAGGGGGGNGGLGGVAGLAAIGAVLAAALASDDDDNNFVPRPTSPALP
jgi:hypothetical protein